MDIKEKRILLVDDEPIMTKALSQYLAAAGYYCVEMLNDPLEVENRIAEYQPHVLLLDISMPKKNGLSILECLSNLVINDELTVIMVTAVEEDYIKRKALILGACDFISKPVDRFELVERVENALNGRPNAAFLLNSLPPKSTSF